VCNVDENFVYIGPDTFNNDKQSQIAVINNKLPIGSFEDGNLGRGYVNNRERTQKLRDEGCETETKVARPRSQPPNIPVVGTLNAGMLPTLRTQTGPNLSIRRHKGTRSASTEIAADTAAACNERWEEWGHVRNSRYEVSPERSRSSKPRSIMKNGGHRGPRDGKTPSCVSFPLVTRPLLGWWGLGLSSCCSILTHETSSQDSKLESARTFGDTDSDHSNEESACGAAVRSAGVSVADHTETLTGCTSDAEESDTEDDPGSNYFTVSALIRTDVRLLSPKHRSAFRKELLAEIGRYLKDEPDARPWFPPTTENVCSSFPVHVRLDSVDYEWLNSSE